MRHQLWGMFTFVCLLVATYIFAMFQGGFLSWFLFFSILLLTVATFLWYVSWFKGLSVERTIQTKQAVAGDTLQVTLTIKNKWPWVPYAYLVIEDELDAKWLNNGKYSVVVYPWFKKELILEYWLTDLPRGVLRFKQLTVETGDLFGFVHKRQGVEQREQVLVYPQYHQLTSWQNGMDRRQGRAARQYKGLEDMSAVAGVRDYRPGDRLTRIHWKASARSVGLKTKEFEQPLSTDVVFFFDREVKGYPPGDDTLFELGVILTASLVHYAVIHALASGLVSHGPHGLELIPLSQRHDSLTKAFAHLAQVEADSAHSFREVLLQQSSYVPGGATQVIISPQLTKELVFMLVELSHRQHKIEFFWLKGTQDSVELRMDTNEEQRLLGMLQQAKLIYYVIEDNQFQEMLARGGGSRYASPTHRHV